MVTEYSNKNIHAFIQFSRPMQQGCVCLVEQSTFSQREPFALSSWEVVLRPWNVIPDCSVFVFLGALVPRDRLILWSLMWAWDAPYGFRPLQELETKAIVPKLQEGRETEGSARQAVVTESQLNSGHGKLGRASLLSSAWCGISLVLGHDGIWHFLRGDNWKLGVWTPPKLPCRYLFLWL